MMNYLISGGLGLSGGSTIGANSYLDGFSPSPRCVLSLRKMISTATNSIRVRRSSDNTEQDIGFTGNVLDTASLATFVGANSAYVVTFYDQTGNGENATASTNAKQPRIVNAGTYDGKLVFDASDDTLIITALDNTTNYCGVYSKIKQAFGAVQLVFESSTNYNNNAGTFTLYANVTDYGAGMNDAISGQQRSTDFNLGLGTQGQLTLLWDRTFTNIDEIKAFVNGSSITPTANGTFNQAATFSTHDVYIGSRGDASFFSSMELETWVFYNSDTSGIQTSIEGIVA